AFTVMTKIAFGLVAVVIGFAVGFGVTKFSGNKRSVGLQVMAVIVAALSFFYASYLVNRTFVQKALLAGGQANAPPPVPRPGLFFRRVSLDFGMMDLFSLAIVLYQA